MATINVNLISGRSVQQGGAIEGGKEKPLYRTAAGIIELDLSDLKRLGAWKNTNVRVTSDHGSVVVKAAFCQHKSGDCLPHPSQTWHTRDGCDGHFAKTHGLERP